MSKACGLTGPLHANIRTETLTESGEKSTLIDVFLDKTTKIEVEVQEGSGKNKTVKKVFKGVLEAVRNFVLYSIQEKSFKDQKEENADILRAYSAYLRLEHAKNGKYHPSYRLNGSMSESGLQYATQASAQERFSMPKKDSEYDVIKEILGDEIFLEFFSREVDISIRKDILEDRKQRRELTEKLVEALGADGLKKYFMKKDCWEIKPGLAEALLSRVSEEIRNKFLEICPQYADQIKDVTYTPEK